MFYFRVNKIRIVDNRESGFWFFKRDLAEIKLISFITTGDTSFPDLDGFVSATDPAEKARLAETMVKQVVSSRLLTTVRDVRDGQTLTFGDTGYVLYQAESIPSDFHWCLLALEDDGGDRKLGEAIKGIAQHDKFGEFTDALAVAVKAAANPAFAAGVTITGFVSTVVARFLEDNRDDMVGLLYASFDRATHYPHGERKRDDVVDLTKNMYVDYSIFGFEQQ